jgi:hypothetical protein
MNFLSKLLAITLCLIAVSRALAADAPPDPDTALTTAAGVSLAEVLDLKQIDQRPGDGNLFVQVSLKPLQKSGDVLESVEIVKDFGGLRAPHSAPPDPDSLYPVPFQKGKRYWFVWSSRHEWIAHPHRLIGWWPQDDASAAEVFGQAIAKDRFAWQPQLEPITGISYDHHLDAKTGNWILRGTKAGKVVWEDKLEGSPVEGAYGAWYVYPRKNVPDLAHVQAQPDDLFLGFLTSTKLPAKNSYGVPAGTYWLECFRELTTGKELEVQVRSPQMSHVEWMTRAYNRTGQRLWEREKLLLKTGGRAVGAASEAWLKQIERTFDPDNGKTLHEDIFRIDSSNPVKINPPK